ncbi:MAG TPA: FliH/SctL family protein [Alphaproteobacteria bacterium]|nr:FliH/SctL family protein [Alphaproteobacteria bacterium]HNS44886.1 FliH/SctL family protein [Alphaproteobacteria bacterium]
MNNDRRKYFFDANNFDNPNARDRDEDLPPPPPVFSLEELGAAKDVSFELGREQGIEEARVSREQYIASQISGIHDQIRALLLAEQMREKKFEEDVLSLCRALLTRIFPSLAAAHSIDEILNVVRNILAQQDQAKIIIEVPAADFAEISASLELLIESEQGRIQITQADDLEMGSCRMKWENGGALRDQGMLVDAVLKEIEDGLAPKAQKSDNSESENDVTEGDSA